MRHGIVVLPETSWREAAPRWRAAEELGFDHAWTYDHVVWAGLPDSPWFASVPTLTAAATITERIGLGTFVASPNFRHPVPFHREIQALDDISEGRFLLGVGTGGDVDSRILGAEDLSVKDRVDRFQEFVDLLVRLRTEDHVDADGRWFSAVGARTLPALRQVPLLVAGNGPRSVRYAARVGDGWVTTGPRVDSVSQWWSAVAGARDVLEQALVDQGRDPDAFPRYLSLDASGQVALESAAVFADMVGRAEELGFSDVVVHWPRAQMPYAATEAVLEQVADTFAR